MDPAAESGTGAAPVARERRLVGRELALIAGLIGLAVALCWPTWGSVARSWSDAESRYTHGWLAVAISVWLLLRVPPESVPTADRRLTVVPIAALVPVSAGWAIAETAALQWAAQLLALVLAMLLVRSVVDPIAASAVARVLQLPLLALPMWDAADVPMHELTIAGVSAALWLIRLPVQLDGQLVTTPHGTFDIEIGCNGLQMLLAAWTVAAAMAARQHATAARWFKMMAFAGLIAIAANWLRITIVVVVGYVSEMRHYLVSNEHYSLGWLLFAVGMASFARFSLRPSIVAPPLAGASAASGVETSASGLSPWRVLAGTASAGVGPVLALLSVLAPMSAARIFPTNLADRLSIRNSDVDWATDASGAVRWWAVDVRDRKSSGSWATYQYLEFDRISPTLDDVLSTPAFIDWPTVQRRSDVMREDGFYLGSGIDRNGQPWALAWRLSVAGRPRSAALSARLHYAALRLLGAQSPIRLERLAIPCSAACAISEAEILVLLKRLPHTAVDSARGAA